MHTDLFNETAPTHASGAPLTRKETKAESNWRAFASTWPAVAKWLKNNEPSSPFAASLASSVSRYGSLTAKQLNAVERSIARTNIQAPEVNNTFVRDALRKASENGIKRPRMVFAGFTFTLAKESSVNAGAVYVKDDDRQYLGKVMDGKFSPSYQCSDEEVVANIAKVLADPSEQARAYGIETGVCCCCNRTLTDPESIKAGIGPICAGKYGL